LPTDNSQQNLSAAINEVSDRMTVLVREEIELAKAEVSQKATKLGRGIAVGLAAGIFIAAGLSFLLQSAAWAAWRIVGGADYWFGFLFVAILLFALGAAAGIFAYGAVKGGSPPAPTMAIDEAKKIRETVTASVSDGK
jgi:uncharacterized membrane protein YgcG